jgi:hypothetical protein
MNSNNPTTTQQSTTAAHQASATLQKIRVKADSLYTSFKNSVKNHYSLYDTTTTILSLVLFVIAFYCAYSVISSKTLYWFTLFGFVMFFNAWLHLEVGSDV